MNINKKKEFEAFYKQFKIRNYKKYDDHMADERNITLEELAEAAIANDMHAGQTLDNIKDSLTHITPDMLEEKIEEIKAKQPEDKITNP